MPTTSRLKPERDERGAASLVQTVIAAPALLFLIMLVVQVGLVAHAHNVAEQAAQEGTAAARRYDGTESQGSEKANQFLGSVGQVLQNRTVTVTRTPEVATVTVTGTAKSLVPWPKWTVSEQASGPVERYVAPLEP